MHKPLPSRSLSKHCPRCVSCSSISVLGNLLQYGHWKFSKHQWFPSEAAFFSSFLDSSLNWEVIWKIRPLTGCYVTLIPSKESSSWDRWPPNRRQLLQENSWQRGPEEVGRPRQQMWRKHKRRETNFRRNGTMNQRTNLSAHTSGSQGCWGRESTPDLISIEMPHQILCSGVVHMFPLDARAFFLWIEPSTCPCRFWTVILLLAQLQVLSGLLWEPQGSHSHEVSALLRELENETWKSAFLMPESSSYVVVVVFPGKGQVFL